ncbi:MAG: type IV pilin-like G/H family protein [Planktothrix sp.]|uniref:type IV pilin-like G/H family protein n=1 Tax=Planktothrix sp. TaxID=3088171 RepID=UPI0038D44CA9
MLIYLSTFKKAGKNLVITPKQKSIFILTIIFSLMGFMVESIWLKPAISSVILATKPQDLDTQKLVGRWQIPTNLSSGIIFTEEGKIYIFTTPIEALELQYTIDPNFRPGLMIFRDREGKIVGTAIFELTETGELQLDLNITGEEQPAITTFQTQPLLFKKMSDSARMPTSVTIKTPTASELKEQADQDTQLEAKQYIEIMNRGHQTSYAQYNLFKPNLEEFIKGLPAETRNYLYNIRIIDEKSMVQSVAQAKRTGLKSYIGIVYIIQPSSASNITTKSILCESDQPTQQLPSQPSFFTSRGVSCPAGYSVVSQ